MLLLLLLRLLMLLTLSYYTVGKVSALLKLLDGSEGEATIKSKLR